MDPTTDLFKAREREREREREGGRVMEERTIHPIPNSDNPTEAERFIRDAPPAHYTFKIESFSLLLEMLAKTGMEKHESGDFEIAGYKWRLSLYPYGDKKRNGTGHISLNLILSETNNLPLGLEVNARFKLFVYDHIRDKYLTVQDVSKQATRFHALKTEWGFAKLLPLGAFNDDTNGYLVDDCCIFGAEVFVTNCTGKGESFSILKEPQKGCFTWKIDKFSQLDKDFIDSEVFNVGGHKWYLTVYPNGDTASKDKSLSLYINLQDFSTLHPGQKLYVECKLGVKDQVHDDHIESTFQGWLSSQTLSWGYPSFLPLSDLKNAKKGFIQKDTLIVQAQITRLSVVKNFS